MLCEAQGHPRSILLNLEVHSNNILYVVIYFCLSMMFCVHSSRSRNDEWMHAKYIMMINLVKVLLEKISINYVPVWFSGGKGLTHVGVKLEFLSFSFHGQKVH